MRRRLNILLVGLVSYCSPAVAQQRDSTLNTDSMYYYIYSDTSDWEDFISDTSVINLIGMTDDQRYACRAKRWDRRNFDFNLCNSDPYVLIFHDDFKTFDEGMWFQRNDYGLDWNWWNSDNDAGLCIENDDTDKKNNMQGQQLYMRENVVAENGFLKIKTTPVAWAVDWCGNGNSMYPDGQNNCQNNFRPVNFYYTSGRAQTSWAFSRGANLTGDGLIVQARIKVPDFDGLWPAFWLHTINDPSDEFDVFEFMDNEWEKLKMTIHHGGWDPTYQCREEKKLFEKSATLERRAFFDEFHTYTFFYTDYSLAVFVDGNLMWQKHHGSRQSGLWHFDCEVSKNEYWGERIRYCDRPMRIVFNTHVYCKNNSSHPDPNNPITAAMEIDYLNVWRKLPCVSNKTLTTRADLGLENHEYNVIAAKKVVVNIDHTNTTGYDVTNNNFLKLIANDYVVIDEITVDPTKGGRLEVDITKADLCTDAFDFNKLDVVRRSNKQLNGIQTYKSIQSEKNENLSFSDNVVTYQRNSDLIVESQNGSEIISIEIFDMCGRRILVKKSNKYSAEMSIDTNEIINGIYTIFIKFSDGKFIMKRVVINNT